METCTMAKKSMWATDENPLELGIAPLNMRKDGKKFKAKGITFEFVCCDCGLMHRFGIAINDEDNTIIVLTERDDRSTAQYRRHHSAQLIEGVGMWKMVRRCTHAR
jgi:hypothetical protein